jgi:hypothetical protein
VALRARVLEQQAVQFRQRIDAAPRLGPRVGIDDRERVLERVLVDSRDPLGHTYVLARVAPYGLSVRIAVVRAGKLRNGRSRTPILAGLYGPF